MPSAGKIYLIAYNLLQLFCWATCLTELIRCATTKENLWTVTSPGLKFFQTLAVLEVVHAAAGLVRSGALVTATQVASRVGVLWMALNYSEASRESVGFPILLTAWTLAEIIRYGFYLTTLLKIDLFPLTWLRYSMFIVLYPMGITGELLALYNALPKYASDKPLAGLAGGFNWVYYAMIAVMLSYIPVFPKLYGHMLSQRKKALGGPTVSSRKKQ